METYRGGCHCKDVRYEVELDLGAPVLECNCSHCQAQGALLCFTGVDYFKLISGEGKMSDYRFHTEKIEHLFCARCGIEAFGRGKNKEGNETIAVNVRTIDDIDLATLTRMPVDGKSF